MVKVYHAVVSYIYEPIGVEVVEIGFVPTSFGGSAIGSASTYGSDSSGEVNTPRVASDRSLGKARNAQYALRLSEQGVGEVAV